MRHLKQTSRFDTLFETVKQSDRPDLTKAEVIGRKGRPSKSADPEYKRTTIYIRKSLHRQLKAAAANQGKEMSEIVEQMIENYIKFRSHPE